MPRSLKNGDAPQKIIFRRILENFFFFFEKIVKWKISKTSIQTKKVILIFVAIRQLPSK